MTTTAQWFKEAVPTPNKKNFHVQLGVHLEEVVEMMQSLLVETEFNDTITRTGWISTAQSMHMMAEALKTGKARVVNADWKELLDSLCDQKVTATGIGHMIGADMDGATKEVDASNFSKFVDGKAIFDANGKIAKGPNFFRPKLDAYLPEKVTILD
jgi:predicted HAD superfamily Cof-like phosphohydrolase